jgi:hypothetical protein
MSLLNRLRSNAYRIRAAAYLVLGVFLVFVVINNESWEPFSKVLALAVALIAIVGGLRRALRP